MKLVAEDLMEADVITVQKDLTIEQVNQIFSAEKISGLPVLDGNSLVGIISKTDINHALSTQSMSKHSLISEIMITDIVSVTPNTDISEVAVIMTSKNIHRVLVCQQQKLIGIISAMDFVKILQLTKMTQTKPVAIPA